MDCNKTGKLIRHLRQEKRMTQRELASRIGVGDKAISKWECGGGCPDVSLFPALADAFGVGVEQLLNGSLPTHEQERGNMKRLKFYVCPQCASLSTAMGEAEISCCGRKLAPLEAKEAEEEHQITIEDMDGEWYITFSHEMKKKHFIDFVACIGYDRAQIVKLYPEQGSELRMAPIRGGKIFIHCNRHGLYQIK